METMISKLPFVEILKVGFSGFCFLMALLAYLLLNKEQSKEEPNHDVLKAINKFLYFGLTFGVLVLLSSILPAVFSKNGESVVELEGKINKLDGITSEKMVEISRLNKENKILKDGLHNIKNINKQNVKDLTNAQQYLENLISGFIETNGPIFFSGIKAANQAFLPMINSGGFNAGGFYGKGPMGVVIKTNKSMEKNAKKIFEHLENAIKGNAKLDSTASILIYDKLLIDQLKIDFLPLRIRTERINISLDILINGKILKTALLGEGTKWVSDFQQTFFVDLGTNISMKDLSNMVIKTKIISPEEIEAKPKGKEREVLMISIYGKSNKGEIVLLPPLFDLTEKSLVSSSLKELGFRYLE